jgi:hypothetical protein
MRLSPPFVGLRKDGSPFKPSVGLSGDDINESPHHPANTRKNSTGVAIRNPLRRATAGVKCLTLCVSTQSGRAAIAEREH